MTWWGKLIGGAFGFLSFGPLGAVLGAALGHTFDKGLAGLKSEGVGGFAPGEQERVQIAFFSATFSVMGHLAKSDGRVSPDEIALAEAVMAQMSLTPEKRKLAINLFNEGKKNEFSLEEILHQFNQECHGRRNLKRIFIEILLNAAFADDVLHKNERKLLQHIAESLGFNHFEYQRLEASVQAARTFFGNGAGSSNWRRPDDRQTTPVEDDYTVLGVEADASNEEIKKAYRRLMNQHHPDKLVSKGLPEEMIQLATQKTHEIRAAYDRIRKKRAF